MGVVVSLVLHRREAATGPKTALQLAAHLVKHWHGRGQPAAVGRVEHRQIGSMAGRVAAAGSNGPGGAGNTVAAAAAGSMAGRVAVAAADC